ncbi:MAG: DUF4301 family protein [Bacteroidetes bacterium]|nr:DUF4301 family protein [Bacteroidota bacterium]
MFTKDDLEQFEKKNIPPEKIERQIENFEKGFPFIKLADAATPAHGISVLNNEQLARMTETFEKKAKNYSITKMVPASGAASRMFKGLFAYMESEQEEADQEVKQFIERIEDFAFYTALKNKLADDAYDIYQLISSGDYKTIIRYLLTEDGLNYASLPKGLLLFHNYPEGPRTPLEEHMMEGFEYSRDISDNVHIHFTVSPGHKEKFMNKATEAASKFQEKKKCSFDITYSVQKPSTDTIAVDMNNEPFRDPDGSILFRPGGHGALIENLNELDADIAFIKNIDNLVPDKLREPTITYKKVLGGLLMRLMEKSFAYLSMIKMREAKEEIIDDAIAFVQNELNIHFPEDIHDLPQEDKMMLIAERLNRPIRICGMVRNEGEPGGGPFLVQDSSGNISLQIVESSQINMEDETQKAIISQATHFNPVDLVCNLKNYKGEKFDLREFIDPQTGFISVKSKDGKELKAQELPGLWNGAMARWITIFVEVPIETFSPVKMVNDLLRPQHQ